LINNSGTISVAKYAVMLEHAGPFINSGTAISSTGLGI
jgi:hypothetical protein